jgi:hypothetical protein
MYQSVMNSNIQPIAMAFDIKAFGNDSLGMGQAAIIDITDNITSDNEVFGFGGASKGQFKVGSFQSDKSYIVSVRPYPTNIEITTVKTFSKTPDVVISVPGAAPRPSSMATITVEMNSSMVLLPEKPMKARFEDKRVGYFGTSYKDYDANPQGVKEVALIARWRLEPSRRIWKNIKRDSW